MLDRPPPTPWQSWIHPWTCTNTNTHANIQTHKHIHMMVCQMTIHASLNCQFRYQYQWECLVIVCGICQYLCTCWVSSMLGDVSMPAVCCLSSLYSNTSLSHLHLQHLHCLWRTHLGISQFNYWILWWDFAGLLHFRIDGASNTSTSLIPEMEYYKVWFYHQSYLNVIFCYWFIFDIIHSSCMLIYDVTDVIFRHELPGIKPPSNGTQVRPNSNYD